MRTGVFAAGLFVCLTSAASAAAPPPISTREALTHFFPQDVLDALDKLTPEQRVGVCQGDPGVLYELRDLKPASILKGSTSARGSGDADVVRVINDFANGVSQVSAAALVRDDDAQKTLLIRLLAKWANAKAYLQTPDCYHRNCPAQWTSNRGTEKTVFSDSDAVNERIAPIVLSYYLILRDFKTAELAPEHAAIQRYLVAWEKRLPNHARSLPPDIYFGFNLDWQVISLAYDLGMRGQKTFDARIKALADKIGSLVLDDGSLDGRTVRGSRALWYHYASLNELFVGLEILRANGVDLYRSLAPRLEKSVQIFIDGLDDVTNGRNTAAQPASIYKWAKQDYRSAGDPKVQEFEKFAGSYAGGGSSWMFIYLQRFPGTDNAKRLRAHIATLKELPSNDGLLDFNVGCLYRLSDASFIARDEHQRPLVPEAELASLADSIDKPAETIVARPIDIGSMQVVDFGGNRETDSFLVQLTDVAFAGQTLPNVNFRIFANYNPSFAKSVKTFNALRIVQYHSALSDPESHAANFVPCGDMADDGSTIRLHYGAEATMNRCIFEKLGQNDRALWAAIYVNLPAWVDKAAAAGDKVALKLQPMFKKKLAEKT